MRTQACCIQKKCRARRVLWGTAEQPCPDRAQATDKATGHAACTLSSSAHARQPCPDQKGKDAHIYQSVPPRAHSFWAGAAPRMPTQTTTSLPKPCRTQLHRGDFQNWKIELFHLTHRQAKSKGVHYHDTGFTRNIKGSSLFRKGKVITRNKKIQERKKISLVKVHI